VRSLVRLTRCLASKSLVRCELRGLSFADEAVFKPQVILMVSMELDVSQKMKRKRKIDQKSEEDRMAPHLSK
jgi:hypothetical protein